MAWVVIRLVPTGLDPARKWMRPSRFISRLRPFCRKVRKKQRLWRTATTGWSASCAVKKNKTNVIAAQSAPNGPERGPNRAVSPGLGCVFRGFGEYLVDEVT